MVFLSEKTRARQRVLTAAEYDARNAAKLEKAKRTAVKTYPMLDEREWTGVTKDEEGFHFYSTMLKGNGTGEPFDSIEECDVAAATVVARSDVDYLKKQISDAVSAREKSIEDLPIDENDDAKAEEALHEEARQYEALRDALKFAHEAITKNGDRLSKACADWIRDARKAEAEKLEAEGRKAGVQWAQSEATEANLIGLQDWRDDLRTWHSDSIGAMLIDEPYDGTSQWAESILDNAGLAERSDSEAAVEFFGAMATKPVFLAGWCDGAMEAWDAVRGEPAAE